MHSNPDSHRGRIEQTPCDARDMGDCGACIRDRDSTTKKRGRGQGSTLCAATCVTTGRLCNRNVRDNTIFCKQHTPFILPDDITEHMLGFMTREARTTQFAKISRQHEAVANKKEGRQIWGDCHDCRKNDKTSLYFKRAVDKNCPNGSKMVECGLSGTECCTVPLVEDRLHFLLKNHGHENNDMFEELIGLEPSLIADRPGALEWLLRHHGHENNKMFERMVSPDFDQLIRDRPGALRWLLRNHGHENKKMFERMVSPDFDQLIRGRPGALHHLLADHGHKNKEMFEQLVGDPGLIRHINNALHNLLKDHGHEMSQWIFERMVSPDFDQLIRDRPGALYHLLADHGHKNKEMFEQLVGNLGLIPHINNALHNLLANHGHKMSEWMFTYFMGLDPPSLIKDRPGALHNLLVRHGHEMKPWMFEKMVSDRFEQLIASRSFALARSFYTKGHMMPAWMFNQMTSNNILNVRVIGNSLHTLISENGHKMPQWMFDRLISSEFENRITDRRGALQKLLLVPPEVKGRTKQIKHFLS